MRVREYGICGYIAPELNYGFPGRISLTKLLVQQPFHKYLSMRYEFRRATGGFSRLVLCFYTQIGGILLLDILGWQCSGTRAMRTRDPVRVLPLPGVVIWSLGMAFLVVF